MKRECGVRGAGGCSVIHLGQRDWLGVASTKAGAKPAAMLGLVRDSVVL
jgi:hypothetical protein